MRTALLRGREHTQLSAIATVAEDRAAIALSRGGAAKTYAYREANEDACAFALSDDALLVAVADGHWGSRGAVIVLERLLETHARRWTAATAAQLEERWTREAPEVALDLNASLLDESVAGVPPGRTTLTLCVARPAEDLLLALAVGDSHFFRVEEGRAREIVPVEEGRTGFLGDAGLDRESAGECVRAHTLRGADRGAVVLATDGLSEWGIGVENPPGTVAESVEAARRASPELRPLEAARGLAERVNEAHRRHGSGDNIATAVAWLDRS